MRALGARQTRDRGEETTVRRTIIGFIITCALRCLLVAPLGADAQPPTKVYRIGWLNLGYPNDTFSKSDQARPDLAGLRQGLRELGYVEGQNLGIEERYAEGKVERLSDLATELVRLKVDVIIAAGSAAIRAAQQATSTIPIVMTTDTDAVSQGFVVSLAQPGGNITGLAGLGVELHGKRLELLREVLPTASRIAALWNPDNASLAPFLHETQTTGQALGVELQALEVRTPNEFEGAFAVASSGRAAALIVMADAFLLDHRMRIVDLAQRHRLPGMYPRRSYVDVGGLMAYGL